MIERFKRLKHSFNKYTAEIRPVSRTEVGRKSSTKCNFLHFQRSFNWPSAEGFTHKTSVCIPCFPYPHHIINSYHFSNSELNLLEFLELIHFLAVMKPVRSLKKPVIGPCLEPKKRSPYPSFLPP
jgi:hypothetical protein